MATTVRGRGGLLALLPTLQKFQCEDPRDRIYGALPIISDQPFSTRFAAVVKPDYTISAIELAIKILDFTPDLLDVEALLSCLKIINHGYGNYSGLIRIALSGGQQHANEDVSLLYRAQASFRICIDDQGRLFINVPIFERRFNPNDAFWSSRSTDENPIPEATQELTASRRASKASNTKVPIGALALVESSVRSGDILVCERGFRACALVVRKLGEGSHAIAGNATWLAKEDDIVEFVLWQTSDALPPRELTGTFSLRMTKRDALVAAAEIQYTAGQSSPDEPIAVYAHLIAQKDRIRFEGLEQQRRTWPSWFDYRNASYC